MLKIRLLSLLLSLLTVASLVGCTAPTPDGPVTPDEPSDVTDAPIPTPDEPVPDEPVPDEPEIVEPPHEVLDIIENGQSVYVLVYEDALKEQAQALLSLLEELYGASLAAVAASEAEDDYVNEIVLGNVRPSSRRLSERLNGTNDFAMCIDGNDWVLFATEPHLYTYMLAVLEKKLLSPADSLQIKQEKDFVYHDSLYKYKGYLEFVTGGARMSQDMLAELFEARSFTAEDGTTLAYRLYVPYDYTPQKDYPVLLVLHGAGERGNDNKGNILYMFPEMFALADTPVSDAIIIAPQCPAGNQWVDTPWAKGSYSVDKVAISNELSAVMELLGEISMEYMTDPDRYYVMGLSMGGFGTWDLLMRYPDVFAAGIPICGGADPDMAELLVNMPIRTFHGSADPVVPVAGTREMAAALEAAGSTVFSYEEMEGRDHGIWSSVASNKSAIDWLFRQSK